MSLPTLADLKAFLRITGDHLDATLAQALNSAKIEAGHFIGGTLAERWPIAPPSDVVQAVMLLAQVHVDAGTPQEHEYRRAAAQSLLRPYRLSDGFA